MTSLLVRLPKLKLLSPIFNSLEEKLANFDVTEQEAEEPSNQDSEPEESQNQEFNLLNDVLNNQVTQHIEQKEPIINDQKDTTPPSEPIIEESKEPEQTIPQQPPIQPMIGMPQQPHMGYPMMMPGQPMNGQMPMMQPMMVAPQMMQQPMATPSDGSTPTQQQTMPMYQYMMPMNYNQLNQPVSMPQGEDGKDKPQVVYMQPVYAYPQGYNMANADGQMQPQQPMYMPMMQSQYMTHPQPQQLNTQQQQPTMDTTNGDEK